MDSTREPAAKDDETRSLDAVRVEASPVRCPYCHDEIGARAWVACAGCLARHHAACWTASRQCATCNDPQSLVGSHALPRPSRFHGLKGTAFLLAFLCLTLYTGYQILTQIDALAHRETTTGYQVLTMLEWESEREKTAPAPPDAETASLRAAASRHYLGENEAVVTLRLRAGEGDADAMFELAKALETADGVSPDKEAARDWYLRAADAGNVRAMMWLGAFYSASSEGDASDDGEKSRFWYGRAADLGEPAAMLMAATMAEDSGKWEKAEHWLEMLAARGDHEQMLHLSKLLIANGGDGRRDEALAWREKGLAPLKASGKTEDMFALAKIYSSGDYGADMGAAVFWRDKALAPFVASAKAGTIPDMLTLARHHRDGEYGWVDKSEALRWYEAAARAGDRETILALAEWYASPGSSDGLVDGSDLPGAREAWEMAAKVGYTRAMRCLAYVAWPFDWRTVGREDVCYSRLVGQRFKDMRKDRDEALRWARQAVATGGEPLSLALLGDILGSSGIPALEREALGVYRSFLEKASGGASLCADGAAAPERTLARYRKRLDDLSKKYEPQAPSPAANAR